MELKRKKVSFTSEEMRKVRAICDTYQMQPSTWIRMAFCEKVNEFARRVQENKSLVCSTYGELGVKESVDVRLPEKSIEMIIQLKKQTGFSYEALIRLVVLPEIERKAEEVEK